MKNGLQQIVLLITVGAQDVKLWKRGSENDPNPEVIRGRSLRDKHKAIKADPNSWTVLTRKEFLQMDPSRTVPSPGAEKLADVLGCTSPVYSRDGRLCLALAKIEPIVEGILEHRRSVMIVGALIFSSERSKPEEDVKKEDKRYNNEPIASGSVARTWLQERLGIDAVEEINYTEGLAGALEGGIDEHDDFPLRREIVHRMDRSIVQFLEQFSIDEILDILPATLTTGGFDSIKQLVPALADLRFRHRVRDLSAPETGTMNAPIWRNLIAERLCAAEPRITRHEALAARGRALELLRHGDPISAWAAVYRYDGSKLDQWWLNPLAASAEYFGGAASESFIDIDSIPSAPDNAVATDRWKKALDSASLNVEGNLLRHQRFALNAAMRVELSLQGPDRQSRRYTEALISVTAMVDAAVIAGATLFLENGERAQALDQWLEDYPKAKKQFFFDGDPDSPSCQRDYWFGFAVRKSNKQLAEILETHFRPLIALDLALQYQQNGTTLRKLRNSASHRSLHLEDIRNIATLAEIKSNRLWNPPGNYKLGHHALGPIESKEGPSLISSALVSIGIKGPFFQYVELMENLESILLTCEPESP